jgi:hypothetical protein
VTVLVVAVALTAVLSAAREVWRERRGQLSLRHPWLEGIPLPPADDHRWMLIGAGGGESTAVLGPFRVDWHNAYRGDVFDVWFEDRLLGQWRRYVLAVLMPLRQRALEDRRDRALRALGDWGDR